MGTSKERSPPRMAGKVVYRTFDWESRKSDYRSFCEEYRERFEHCGAKSAKWWAYRVAGKSLWEALPPDVRGAIVTLLLKLILRN